VKFTTDNIASSNPAAIAAWVITRKKLEMIEKMSRLRR
jgi:hypothetical protein